MKKNEKRKNFSELDKFDRRQKKASPLREKGSSKNKYSIYDDYDDSDEFVDYSSDEDDDEFED